MERIILNVITQHIQGSRIIRSSQHRFMKGRSCLANLIFFYNKITRFVGERKAVDVVHLDFNKAFDTFSHTFLLEKLTAQGLDACMVCWMKNWLDGWAPIVY